jgi:ATP-binding cassette subfamily F protein 3
MKVGYFTQYQVEELDPHETPVEHMARAMGGGKGAATGGATPGAVRAQLGRFGFSGEKALTRVGKLSGGERARLALALITREAPHMLILDEPTNHLDVDSREALVQALNDYQGAVVIVSHDRHMIALTADRLVLVADGTAREYAGTLDDYTALILAGAAAGNGAGEARPSKKEGRKAAAEARERGQKLRRAAQAAEAEMAALAAARSAIDRTMFDPASADPALAGLTMTELMKERARIEEKIAVAEARWLEASEALEAA